MKKLCLLLGFIFVLTLLSAQGNGVLAPEHLANEIFRLSQDGYYNP